MSSVRDGSSYAEKRAATARRLLHYREQLDALELRESPYSKSRRDELWRAGYEAALLDLASHPEIARRDA